MQTAQRGEAPGGLAGNQSCGGPRDLVCHRSRRNTAGLKKATAMYSQRINYTSAGPRQFQAFSAARQQLLAALNDWLSTVPVTEEVAAEISATLSAIDQLAALNRGTS
jgi:hypothetical protein